MPSPVQRAVVLGAGSAGFLAAVAMRRLVPEVSVAVVHSPNISVIGVGESTTAFLPKFLHDILGLDRKQFFKDVRPSWKMGVRFLWGDPRDSHFYFSFDRVMDFQSHRLRKMNAYYCMEDWHDCAHFWALMDRDLSPCQLDSSGGYQVQPGIGYHIENVKFLAYLKRKAAELGVEIISGDVVDVPRTDAGDVAHLQLGDGRKVEADLFVDCSGFASILLGKAMGERYVSYASSLFCDSAVVGSWPRDGRILPYTISESMDHGWCWRIEFDDHVTRGYVFSSQSCSADEAMAEARRKNPELGDMREVKFRSGRYENFWRNNVVAIGNASGFVEPLEATALHLIALQIQSVCESLRDRNFQVLPETQAIENRVFRQHWDEVRDFLAMHYKFNKKQDTPFWRHCRADTPLGTIQPVVDLYERAGPVRACGTLIPKESMFQYNGYMMLLIGLRAPTQFQNDFTPQELADWQSYRQQVRHEIRGALPVRGALDLVQGPGWRWPTQGV